MPFDNPTKLRQPAITVLPPTGSPEGGGPRRVVINIEIAQRPPARSERRGGGVLAVILWLIILGLLASLHAQQRYEHWQDTNGWHGETRTEGRTTDWTAYGPNGQQKHCHRYYVGDQAYTSCN